MPRSIVGVCGWVGATAVSLATLATSLSLILAEPGFKGAFSGRLVTAWFICFLFPLIIGVAIVYAKFFHDEEEPVNEVAAEARKNKEDFYSSVKVIVDFVTGGFILVYGITHPLWSKEIHGLIIALGGSLGTFSSSVLGLMFFRSPTDGFSALSTTLLQIFIFFGTGGRWLLMGLVAYLFISVAVAFVFYMYRMWQWHPTAVFNLPIEIVVLFLFEVVLGLVFFLVVAKFLIHIETESRNEAAPLPAPANH